MRNDKVINLDREELLQLRDRVMNMAPNPPVRNFQIVSDRSQYLGQPIRGLTFPLTISNGSLAISQDEDRIVEQIFEVVQTLVGERVYRQFFGLPSLVFESVSESVLKQRIESQLKKSVSIPQIELNVKINNLHQESVTILITYTLANKSPKTIKYIVS